LKISMYTRDQVEELKKVYKDKLECDPKYVGTPDYWKQVGVVELIRLLDNELNTKFNTLQMK
jgi:hypothetical protein